LLIENIEHVRKRLRQAAESAGRDPDSIQLVAVSKTVPAPIVADAIRAGVTILGENYIQEAREKIETLGARDVHWHYIGHLQSNKAKYAVRLFDLIHSVDSFKLARELDKYAARAGKVQDVLVQVNVAGEITKSGTSPDEARPLLRQIIELPHVRVRGLMTMPPYFNAPDRVRPFFAALRNLRDRIRTDFPEIALSELSMGMTGDFEAAIGEGATLVRIGTAIFGERS
jgi:PLP dependent protein